MPKVPAALFLAALVAAAQQAPVFKTSATLIRVRATDGRVTATREVAVAVR